MENLSQIELLEIVLWDTTASGCFLWRTGEYLLSALNFLKNALWRSL